MNNYEHSEKLAERARKIYIENPSAAIYLATISGMYRHVSGADKTNPFWNTDNSKVNSTLYSWFNTGYEASKYAVDHTEYLRLIWEKRDKLEKLKKKQEKGKKSFWNKKIF